MSRTTTLLLICGLSLGVPALAFAQPATGDKPVIVTGAKPAATTKIERYAKVLTLDGAQTEAAKALYEAYQKDTAAASKKTHAAMKDAQGLMEDGDHKAFEERMAKSMREQSENGKKLTDTFLSDLRSILNPNQAERWPALERMRRREQYLGGMVMMGGGSVGGSSVDLIPLIDKLGIPGTLRAKLDEQLALYEVDIDRPLQDRQHNVDDEQKTMGAVQKFDGESFARKQERDRKVDMAIREVNAKYVRQIGAALPEEWARKLAETYDARAYRGIYKDSTIGKKMAAAQKLETLSADQKKSLEAMIVKYKKDAKQANDSWAAAQKAAEDAGRPTGGGLMMMGPGSKESIDPAFASARSARKDVDSAAREQLEKLLTPDQLASIPEPQAGGMMGHQIAVLGDGGGGEFVIAGDVDMPDEVEAGGAGGAPVMIFRTVEVNHGPAVPAKP
jgi:hypothetical protein